MASRIIKIDASAAINAKRIDVNGTRVVATRIDVPFTVAFDDDTEGVTLAATDKGWKYKACGGNPIAFATISVAAADAKAGAVIWLWVSADREIDAPKADSVTSGHKALVTLINNGISVVDQLTGQSPGSGKIVYTTAATGPQSPTTASLSAYLKSATKIGNSAAQTALLTMLYGVHVPSLFNTALMTIPDDSIFANFKLVMECDHVIERSILAVGRVWSFFGIGAAGANALNPNMLGFIYHDGPGGNQGFAANADKLSFGYFVYNSAGNWRDMKIGNTATGGGIIRNVLTQSAVGGAAVGVAASGEIRRLRCELTVVNGAPTFIGYVNGLEVSRITAPVPFMSAEMLANPNLWFPEIRCIRETGGEYVNVFTQIQIPTRLWLEAL